MTAQLSPLFNDLLKLLYLTNIREINLNFAARQPNTAHSRRNLSRPMLSWTQISTSFPVIDFHRVCASLVRLSAGDADSRRGGEDSDVRRLPRSAVSHFRP